MKLINLIKIFSPFLFLQISFSCQPDNLILGSFIDRINYRDYIFKARVIQKINFDIGNSNAARSILLKVSKMYQGNTPLDAVEILDAFCGGVSFTHFKFDTEYFFRISGPPLDTIINFASSWKYFKRESVLNYSEIHNNHVLPHLIGVYPFYRPIETIDDYEKQIIQKIKFIAKEK